MQYIVTSFRKGDSIFRTKEENLLATVEIESTELSYVVHSLYNDSISQNIKCIHLSKQVIIKSTRKHNMQKEKMEGHPNS